MADIKVYGIPNCNTVKKSLIWLEEQAIPFEFHNFKKSGVEASDIQRWFGAFGWEKVINKKGLTFKKLDKEEQAKIVNAESALPYLLNNTSAIKRPIVEKDGQAILLGFDIEAYENKFV